MIPTLNMNPETRPVMKPDLIVHSDRLYKRGTRANQATIPAPYFGKERKSKIPEITANKSLFLRFKLMASYPSYFGVIPNKFEYFSIKLSSVAFVTTSSVR